MQEQAVHSRHHKSRKKGKSVATLASKSSNKPESSPDASLLSSTLALFPPRASLTIMQTGCQMPEKKCPKAARSQDPVAKINKSLDLPTISPGAMHGREQHPNSDIHETIYSNHIIDENPNDVHDLAQIVVATEVPSEDEMAAEMKRRLEKEIKEEVEMRFMADSQTPVIAEAMRDANANVNQKPLWRTWVCFVLVVTLIIVVSVTSIVTTVQRHDNKSSSEVKNDAQPPVICLGATPIQKGQTTISSWIDPAIRAKELSFSAASGLGQNPEPNAWFSLIGTGDAYEVSTCSEDLSFDSGLSVGMGSCDNLECFTFAAFNQKRECSESSFVGATVLFRTDVGVPYYIGVEASNAQHGNFTLSIATVVNAPLNSDCSKAIIIKPGDSLISGTITNATTDTHFHYPSGWPYSRPSVWYTLVGTGDTFEISTCTSDLNFEPGITVSTGSCENLEFLVTVAFNQYDCFEEYPSARVNFHTVPGVEYYIQVHEAIGLGFSWIGEFALVVLIGQAPANDACSSAPAVKPGSFVLGSLSHASWDQNMNSNCSYSLTLETPIVWYSLMGTGDVYALSTCSSVLNFDSSISILTGTCDNLECMLPGLITYDCPESSYRAVRTVFRAEIGVVYFIAVEASNYTWEGDFALNVSIAEPPPNDECSGATDIQANNVSVYGTTTEATPSTYFTLMGLFFYPSPDVWYRIVGNNTNTTASVCSDATTYESVIEMYEGDGEKCAADMVLNITPVYCHTEWFAKLGVTYYIRVTGFVSVGQFELTVSVI